MNMARQRLSRLSASDAKIATSYGKCDAPGRMKLDLGAKAPVGACDGELPQGTIEAVASLAAVHPPTENNGVG